ncbi:MAG: hypothetical protein HZC40_11725 [Chloroflexi bacterium]|nr:hypothetical protein [Chloroflexota bacterium]
MTDRVRQIKNSIRVLILVACAALATLACEIVLTSAPTPVVIVITATPAPTQIIAPPPTAQQIAQVPSPSPAPALPTPLASTPIPPTAIPPTNPPQPPAASPTPFLPQLGVFQQDGDNMEARVVGGQIGKMLILRIIACVPNCRTRPDGNDVTQAEFIFNQCINPGSNACQTMRPVYTHRETSAPYCAFGGSNQCDYLNIADPNARFPGTNNVVANSEYIVDMEMRGKNALWSGKTRIKIQR